MKTTRRRNGDLYREVFAYREYCALCKQLSFPVLWPNPVQTRELLEQIKQGE